MNKILQSVLKPFLVLTLTSGIAISLEAQELDGFEYFWNVDPGMGNGTFVSLESLSAEFDSEFDIETTGLPVGRHTLFTRPRTAEGTYGLTRSREVYLISELANAEYFWDVDPGFGNGTPLALEYGTNEISACEQIPTTGLSAGMHYLYVRTKSLEGKWSNTAVSAIELTDTSPPGGCEGDFTMDGQVTTSDLLVLLGAFGTVGTCTGDLNGDDQVNISDMLIFLGAFGATCM